MPGACASRNCRHADDACRGAGPSPAAVGLPSRLTWLSYGPEGFGG